MSLNDRFNASAQDIRTSNLQLEDEQLLELYGLFKQANEGDNTTSQPWAVQVKSAAKWQSWTKLKGMSQDQAKEEYIALVERFKQK